MNRIVWASPAVEDLQDIADYFLEHSPSAAGEFVDQVDEAVTQLTSHSDLGRVVPELARHNITRYREFILAPWRLFYRSEGQRVYVLAVIDGRRNVEDVLLRRLMRK